MPPDDPPPDDVPEPAAAPPPPRPAGLKQLFIGACLFWISPFFFQYGVVTLLLAFLFSLVGLCKARRLRFRIYGVLLSIETAIPVIFFIWHYREIW